jgi:hypothetical protein
MMIFKTNWALAILCFFIALAVGYLFARSKSVEGDGDDTGEPPP